MFSFKSIKVKRRFFLDTKVDLPPPKGGVSLEGFTPLEIRRQRRMLRLPKGNLSLTGFTLIEVLIAIAILAGGLLSVFYMFPLALRQLKESKILMDASFLAKRKLEEVKTYNKFEEAKGEEGGFDWQISLGEVEVLPDISLRKLILKINYNLEGSPFIKEEFITYLPLEAQTGKE